MSPSSARPPRGSDRRGFARQHQDIGAVQYRVGDVVGFGARGARVSNHRIKHLRRRDHQLARFVCEQDRGFWASGTFSRPSPRPSRHVRPSRRRRLRRCRAKSESRRAFRSLRSRESCPRAICIEGRHRPTNERQRDVIDADFLGDFDIRAIFVGDCGDLQLR